MAESIGLIERAAALLRQKETADQSPLQQQEIHQVSTPAVDIVGPELVLDRGRLASFGITLPSTERSRTIEEFRLIKRNLMAAWAQSDPISGVRPSRLIMVASSRPSEGKTFVAINLALAFASERDAKALLIDVDTQHSTLRRVLGIPVDKGIVDVLAGAVPLSDALVRTNIPNLTVLPSGQGGPHVPELFSSRQMTSLVAEMTERFADRFIIIDTPPCMASSDAAALAPLVGQIIFVVEAHRTQQEEIEAGLSMLSSCPRISLLLNKTEQATEHFGSYGYGYHYPGDEGDELRSDKPA